jgi:protoporphyrinogen oxidase
MKRQVTILGAGLSGISTSFHAGHDRCAIYEARHYYGGHIHVIERDGFTWDEGPHVLFTGNDYVRNLFAENVDGEFEEFEASASNYFQGHWIDHPAQSNLYQVPEPLRTKCLESFLEARSQEPPPARPTNYQEWIDQAFGPVFAETFPAAYTRKYWTTEPAALGTDWIGARVYYPSIDDVVQGAKGPLGRSTYWVKKARYPSRGGYLSFARRLADGARIYYGKTLEWINFSERQLGFTDRTEVEYDALVSTIPLPVLIKCSEDAPPEIHEAAALLRASNIFLVDVAARHPARRQDQWIYVYDPDKLSTRISVSERFSPHNAPAGCTGLTVEVYGSTYRPLPADREEVGRRVQAELVEMGLLEGPEAVIARHVRFVPWGQVIFDHQRRPALEVINSFLDSVGVVRVGRYAEWKYLMTHDCVLRSRRAAERL